MKSAQNRNIKANTLYLPDWSALRVESGTASQSTLQQVLNSTGIQTSNSSLYHGGSSSDELYYNTSENMSTNQLYTPFNVGTVTNYQRRLASYDDLPLSHMPSTNGSTLTPGLYHRAVAVNSTVAPTSSHVVSDKFHLRRVPYFSEVQDMLKDIVVHDSSGNAFYEITTTGGVNLEKYTQFPSNSGKYRRQLAFKDETQGITKGTDGLLYYNTPGIAESRIPFYNDIGSHPSITPLTQNRVTFENSNLYHDATIKHTEKHLPSGFSTFRRRIAYHDEIPASTGSTGGGSGTNELTYDSIARTLTHGVANKRIPFYEDIAAHPLITALNTQYDANSIFQTSSGLYHRVKLPSGTNPTTTLNKHAEVVSGSGLHQRRIPFYDEIQDMLKDIVVHDSLGNVFYEVTAGSGFTNYTEVSSSGKYRRQLAFKDEIPGSTGGVSGTNELIVDAFGTLNHVGTQKRVAFYEDITGHPSNDNRVSYDGNNNYVYHYTKTQPTQYTSNYTQESINGSNQYKRRLAYWDEIRHTKYNENSFYSNTNEYTAADSTKSFKDDTITIPSSSGSKTVEISFKKNAVEGTSGYALLCYGYEKLPSTLGEGAHDQNFNYFFIKNSSREIGMFNGSKNGITGSQTWSYSARGSLFDGVYHHFLAVINATSVTIYIDGNIIEQTKTFSSSLLMDHDTNGIAIGNNGHNSATPEYFQGYLKNLYMYNRVLSGDEITTRYNIFQGNSPPSLFHDEVASHPSITTLNSQYNANSIFHDQTVERLYHRFKILPGSTYTGTHTDNLSGFRERRIPFYDEIGLHPSITTLNTQYDANSIFHDQTLGLYHRVKLPPDSTYGQHSLNSAGFHERRIPFYDEIGSHPDIISNRVSYDTDNLLYHYTTTQPPSVDSGKHTLVSMNSSNHYKRRLAYYDEIPSTSINSNTSNITTNTTNITALNNLKRNVVQGAINETGTFRNDALQLGNTIAGTVSLGGFNIKVESDDSRENATKLVISSNDTKDRNPITEITQWVAALKYKLFEFPYTKFKDSPNSNILPREVQKIAYGLNYTPFKVYDSITYSFGIKPDPINQNAMSVYSMDNSYSRLGIYMINQNVTYSTFDNTNIGSSDFYRLFPYYGLGTPNLFKEYLKQYRNKNNSTFVWDDMGTIKIKKDTMNDVTIRFDHLLKPPSETLTVVNGQKNYILTKFPKNLYPSSATTTTIPDDRIQLENISSSGSTSIVGDGSFSLAYTAASNATTTSAATPAKVEIQFTDSYIDSNPPTGVFKVQYKQRNPKSNDSTPLYESNYVKVTMKVKEIVSGSTSETEKEMYLFNNGFWTQGQFIPNVDNLIGKFGEQAGTTNGNMFRGDMSHFNIYVEDENAAHTHPSIVFYQRPKKTMASDGKTVLEKYDIEFFGDVKFQSNVFLGNKNVADAIDAIAYSSNNAEGRTGESTTTSNEAVVLNDNTAIRHLPSSVI